MTQENTNPNVASPHFYENTRWRLLSNTVWNGLILLILVVVVGVGAVSSGSFWAANNLQNILWVWLTAALLVPSMSLIIASGGLDLSVGSVAGLTAVVMATLMTSEKVGIGAALLIGLCLAFVVGLVNGFLIGILKFNAVLVTLAMMTTLKGISYFISPNTLVVADAGFLSSPVLPCVVLVLLVIACVAVTELKLGSTRNGSNPEQKVSWIRQNLLPGLPYVLSATVAGFVGAVYLARLRAATPTLGSGLEFDVILMVVFGGTPMGSGFINLVGAGLAALVIASAQNIVLLNGVSVFAITTGKGLALLVFGPLCHAYYYVVDLLFRNTKKQVALKEADLGPVPKPD